MSKLSEIKRASKINEALVQFKMALASENIELKGITLAEGGVRELIYAMEPFLTNLNIVSSGKCIIQGVQVNE